MEVPVREEAGPVTRDSFASVLHIHALKASPWIEICHGLNYDAMSNRINSLFPVVFPAESIEYKNEELIQLSWVDSPAAGA